jgi:taurine dioxygenase
MEPQTTGDPKTTAAAANGLDLRPTSGHIGAEIHGLDLAQPLAEETITALRQALLRWKVLFFRDQKLTRAQHVAFGRRFGELTPAHPTLPAAFPEHPEILLLDSEQAQALGGTEIASLWHTDVTFVPNPPMGALLHGVVIPPYGGDTQWLNLAVAYERLSEPVQRMIDGLHAVHTNRINVKRGELASEYEQRFRSRPLRAVHPVVRVHPETGEKILFVNPNFTDHVVELSRQESRHLLAMLFEHLMDHELTTRFRWTPGSLAFWDNRSTAHIVPTDIPPGFRRAVERITLAGDLPFGPDGERSYALEGASFQ